MRCQIKPGWVRFTRSWRFRSGRYRVIVPHAPGTARLFHITTILWHVSATILLLLLLLLALQVDLVKLLLLLLVEFLLLLLVVVLLLLLMLVLVKLLRLLLLSFLLMMITAGRVRYHFSTLACVLLAVCLRRSGRRVIHVENT